MSKIKLDGKEFEFKPLDMNDMVILEEKFGGLQEMTKEGRTLTMLETRTLVWLLVRKESKMTEEEVGEKLIPTAENFAETMGSINEAVAGK